jgi:hypothetical protein
MYVVWVCKILRIPCGWKVSSGFSRIKVIRGELNP